MSPESKEHRFRERGKQEPYRIDMMGTRCKNVGREAPSGKDKKCVDSIYDTAGMASGGGEGESKEARGGRMCLKKKGRFNRDQKPQNRSTPQQRVLGTTSFERG